MSETRTKIAEALVEVTNRWIAPNFPPKHKLREFAELDDREQRLNLDYADAALGVIRAAPAATTPCERSALADVIETMEAHLFCHGVPVENTKVLMLDEKFRAPIVSALRAAAPRTAASSAEPVALADRIDAWSPGKNVLVFIARERRLIADALRAYATPPSVGNADAVREAELVKRINGLPHGWLPEVGYVKNVTFDAAEEQLVLAALSAPVDGAWQDISTAPKDRDILAVRIEWWEPENGNHRWIHGNIRQTKWDAERQRFGFNHEKQPTHWTEVPAIPALPIPRNQGQGGGPRS